jgi:predicted regulator of Ras-like GTPase activity (Roadblock/LC7/MglB family)
MDATQALADLTEISSQVEAAVLFDESGEVAASTLPADQDAAALAHAAGELLARARELGDGGEVTQVEASTPNGSVFVVSDGARRIAATTAADPTTGLVFYDLKSCLRDSGAVSDTEAVSDTVKPRRRRTAKKDGDEA